MRKNPEVTDFVYDEKPFSSGNIPGMIQRGSFIQKAIDIEFINILLLSEFDVWHVTILMKKKDEVAKKAAERIIQSIHIQN